MSAVDVLAAVGRIAYALQSSPVVAEVHELRAAVEKLISDRAELLEALQGIIEIGKRDLSNPKYDGFFTTARAAIARATGEGNE